MKNYIAPGKALDVITPAGGYVSGKGYVLGTVFGVAALTSAEGERNVLETEGIYELSGEGDAFAAAYFDAATGAITDASAPGLYKVGIIVGVDTQAVEVRLNGVDVVAVEA